MVVSLLIMLGTAGLYLIEKGLSSQSQKVTNHSKLLMVKSSIIK